MKTITIRGDIDKIEKKWKAKRKPKRSDFDQSALNQIARDKLDEIAEMRLAQDFERKEMMEWIMADNKQYSYLWILASAWVIAFEDRTKELRKEKTRWQRLVTQVRKDSGFQEAQLDQARTYPIEDLVDTNVRVVGGRKTTHCPIHEEKTPSFVIFDDNHWHCFGCQAHGNNAIDFIMATEKVTFKEAVEKLI